MPTYTNNPQRFRYSVYLPFESDEELEEVWMEVAQVIDLVAVKQITENMKNYVVRDIRRDELVFVKKEN